jgi:hypothetical protein
MDIASFYEIDFDKYLYLYVCSMMIRMKNYFLFAGNELGCGLCLETDWEWRWDGGLKLIGS